MLVKGDRVRVVQEEVNFESFHNGIGVIIGEMKNGMQHVEFQDGCKVFYSSKQLVEAKEKPAVIEFSRNKAVIRESSGKSVEISTASKQVIEHLGRALAETPILPPGTVYYRRRGSMSGIILEEPPGIRFVKWIHDRDSDGNHIYKIRRLAFPYVVLGFSMEKSALYKAMVFYRNQPITSSDDLLYHVNLLNVWLDGKVCLGLQNSYLAENIQEAAARIREAFWRNGFNGAISECYNSCAKKTTGDIEEWERRSTENPQFVLNVQWPETQLSVADLMQTLLRPKICTKKQKVSTSFYDLYAVVKQIIADGEHQHQKEDAAWTG